MKSILVQDIRGQCQEVFDEMFHGGLKVDQTLPEEDIMDMEFKFKRRLFGNLNFIGKLVEKKMISLSIPVSILKRLLDYPNLKGSNLNTLEGACKFLESVGPVIDKTG